ncbi:MAG: NAD-binding protein, partial [Candidatus Humimicrobiaceae bacterium]
MNILIIGAGKVGMHLAEDMSNRSYSIKTIEKNPVTCENAGKLKNIKVFCGDGCDPLMLESAGIKITD